MIVVLSGNVSEKNLNDTLSGFKDQHGSGKPARNTPIAEVAKPKSLVTEKKAGITQTYLSIGARTIPSTHPDSPVLDLIGTLLGGGTSSRLFIELREKHAITYDVNSAHCKGKDFGYFGINLAVNNSKLDKAQKIILKELRNLRTQPVIAEELDRAKQIMLGGVLRGMDNPHDSYEIITFMEMQFGNEFALKNYVDWIKAVTCEDLRRVASQYLDENALCTAILKPEGMAKKR
jgi:predicted Zn-dependent peptidase